MAGWTVGPGLKSKTVTRPEFILEWILLDDMLHGVFPRASILRYPLSKISKVNWFSFWSSPHRPGWSWWFRWPFGAQHVIREQQHRTFQCINKCQFNERPKAAEGSRTIGKVENGSWERGFRVTWKRVSPKWLFFKGGWSHSKSGWWGKCVYSSKNKTIGNGGFYQSWQVRERIRLAFTCPLSKLDQIERV